MGIEYHPELNKLGVKVAFSPKCNLHCQYCGGAVPRTLDQPGAMEDFRRTPLETGSISTDALLGLIGAMHESGIKNVRPTGGEPLLRSDWDYVVEQLAVMGLDVDITTNALLLEQYLERKGQLPKGLNIVKVSLDTPDPKKFEEITGGGSLEKLVRGVSAVTKDPNVFVRANRVLTMNNFNERELAEFINFCRGIGMKQVQYLDLVAYPNLRNFNPEYWNAQYVSFEQFQELFDRVYPGVPFEQTDTQFGVAFHKAVLNDGFIVSFKDDGWTMRDSHCNSCSEFCQEGRCLVRVGTDGNVTFCPDYPARLSSFNGVEALRDGSFNAEMGNLATIVANSTQRRAMEEFAQRHGLRYSVK